MLGIFRQVREFLDGRGEAELAAVVVANMRQAEYEPESWLSELQTMQEEGVLETIAPLPPLCRMSSRKAKVPMGI